MENPIRNKEEYSNEELLMLYRTTKNRKYLNMLYTQIEKMIYYTCNRYGKNLMSHANLNNDDLVSIANFAVTKAINTYSFEKKTKFSTVACNYIIQEFHHTYRYYIRRNKEIYLDSIQINTSGRHDEENMVSYTNMIEDITINIEDCVMTNLFLEENVPKLQRALKSLTDKDRTIFRECFIYEKSNEEAGKVVHLASTSISRSKMRVLKLVRKLIENPNALEKTRDPEKYHGSVKEIPGDYRDYLYVLKDNEKEVLLNRVEKKMMLKEIGAELGITEQSVGSMLQRISNKLKQASLGSKTKVKPSIFYGQLYEKYGEYISELRERDQKFLLMKYKDHIPYSKIAEVMNMKATVVSGNMRNAEYNFGNLLLKRGIIENLN